MADSGSDLIKQHIAQVNAHEVILTRILEAFVLSQPDTAQYVLAALHQAASDPHDPSGVSAEIRRFLDRLQRLQAQPQPKH